MSVVLGPVVILANVTVMPKLPVRHAGPEANVAVVLEHMVAELVCEVGNHQEQATTYQQSLEKLETQAECQMQVLENLVAQSGSSPAPALSLALSYTVWDRGRG